MNHFNKITIYFVLFLSSIIFTACSASTGSRYEKSKENEKKLETKKETGKKLPDEDFNMKPYRTKIDLKETKTDSGQVPQDLSVWYGFSSSDTSNNLAKQTVIDRVKGFRVQVFSTDNLKEANDKKSELYSKTNQKNVYIIFDPPFYKVEVGDFTSLQDAKDLSFKLNQMGYNDAHVVNETVNVYE